MTPTAAGLPPGHFPASPVGGGHVAPCPRRIRVRTAAGWVVDTVAAFYVFEHPYYPQYALPEADLPEPLRRRARPTPDDDRLAGYVTVELDPAEEWFEEDEPVHGHPRSPYVRVDALRSHRRVRVTLRRPGTADTALADTTGAVIVFETGLPPRYYLDPAEVDLTRLTPSDTETLCPYKGVTTGYWNAGDATDVAWSYGAPTLALSAIAGLVCFDDSQVDIDVDPR